MSGTVGHFDPLGETEPHTTRYSLTYSYPTSHTVEFDYPILGSLPKKTITLESWQLPLEFRCCHLYSARQCTSGQCYLRDKGGRQTRCDAKGCDGHSFKGKVGEAIRYTPEGSKIEKCFGNGGMFGCGGKRLVLVLGHSEANMTGQ